MIISILICLRVRIRYYSLIGRWLFIFTFAEYVAHNLCCQIRADDISSTCTFLNNSYFIGRRLGYHERVSGYLIQIHYIIVK
jgi:hypothetical protein